MLFLPEFRRVRRPHLLPSYLIISILIESYPATSQTVQPAPVHLTATLLRTAVQGFSSLTALNLQMEAAVPEAAELLGIEHGVDDRACVLNLHLRARLRPERWKKTRRLNESLQLYETRSASNDVESAADYFNVEQVHGDIKVVGRIGRCKDGKGNWFGENALNNTRIYGCAFQRSFMMTEDVLGQMGLRGVVVAHEMGHNAGNQDEHSDRSQIMYDSATEFWLAQHVNAAQCERYIQWATARVVSSAPAGHPPQRPPTKAQPASPKAVTRGGGGLVPNFETRV